MMQEPTIDLSDLSELLEHDLQKVRQLALVFLRSTHDSLGELDAALMRGDIALMRDLGHRIKASAQIVGALGMAQLCEDLEQLPTTNIETEKASAGAIVAQLHALLIKAGELILQQDVCHDKN
jgi:HPt (histidine-containing phosphotransfer) domain-containing protein